MTTSIVPRSAPTAQRGGYLHGLDALRVIASVAVVYAHTVHWFLARGREHWLLSWVERDLVAALHLNQKLSFLGVSTFLVVSGVVVTHVADRERPGQFLWRRISRIAPLFFTVSVLAWCMINLGWYASESGQRSMGVLDLLGSFIFWGFFSTPEVILLVVTWTLLIQVVFYAYVAATIPLLRNRPWIPPAAAAALVCLLVSLSTGLAGPWHRVNVIVAFFPVLCIGQLISLVRTGKVHPVAGTALGVVHFGLFTWAEKIGRSSYWGTSHPRTLALVVLIVLVVMSMNGPISRSEVIRGWSSRTYAIYLVHMLCMYPVLDGLLPVVGADVSLLLALALTALVAEVLHRFVEMPANRWIRGLETRRPVG
jgi:exopolysaccharide production protein ExoZ